MRNKKLLKRQKFVIGIDEVGRGPLAGPVAVCVFQIPVDFKVLGFGPLKDSKKLTPIKRDEIFAKLKILKKEGKLNYSVCYESAKKIDKIGISKCIKKCLVKGLKNINAKPEECLVLLDGGLKAPEEFKNQKTIIKGDEKERVIAFASIMAKVSRDALMCRLSKKYPRYSFETHKGYGTSKHCEVIRKRGLSEEHRRSFCKRFV